MRSWAIIAALSVCLLSIAWFAPGTPTLCNIDKVCDDWCRVPPVGRLPCGGGCSAPIAIQHAANSPCISGGGFSLIGTQYEDKCCDVPGTGVCPNGGSAIDPPPFRFWLFDDYATANSGCTPVVGGSICNAFIDFGMAVPKGIWFLFQANWLGPSVDGCVTATGLGEHKERTVVDIAFPHGPSEGQATHNSWYLIASVDKNADGFDFDRIRGGGTDATAGACGATGPRLPAVIPISKVPGLTILQPSPTPVSLVCTGSTVHGTVNTLDSNYYDVEVKLDNSKPDYYTEAGRDDPAVPLIDGIEILYAETGSASAPPTTSRLCDGSGNVIWQPARNPIAPSLPLGPIRWGSGACGTRPVTLPIGGQPYKWLAARVVYRNRSPIFPTPTPGASPTPITLGSWTSAHCGPVTYP